VKITLLWVGKTQESWVKDGIDEYAGRFRRYFPLTIAEAKEEKGAQAEAGRRTEGVRLEKLLPKGARLVLLDERGEGLTSTELAAFISRERDNGAQELAFAIGGAYGFSDDLRRMAYRTISLSPMTFTHQMVRVFLLEQLYRACTIMNNENYHH
jgi:23S rRNA (pseudouridine1915-N3)-methyltransferase